MGLAGASPQITTTQPPWSVVHVAVGLRTPCPSLSSVVLIKANFPAHSSLLLTNQARLPLSSPEGSPSESFSTNLKGGREKKAHTLGYFSTSQIDSFHSSSSSVTGSSSLSLRYRYDSPSSIL